MAVKNRPPQFQQYESTQSAAPTFTPGTVVNNPTGSANTKDTTWTTLIASTSFDAQLVLVYISASGLASTNTATLIDIGIGAAASETVLIPDLLAGWSPAPTTLGGFPRHAIFPLYVPAGSRLSARSQSVRTTGSTRVWVELLGGPRGPEWWCGSEVKAYGITSASSIGTNVTQGGSSAEGSWTSIGTTSQQHKALIFMAQGSNTDTVMQTAGQDWDVGIDTTSTAILAEDFLSMTSTAEQLGSLGVWMPIYSDIPSGTVLAARGSSSVATPDVIDVALYGVS